MLRSLIAAVSLIASLSASDAAPGDVLRVYAGCAGVATIAPQQGLAYGPTRGTGNAQTIDVRVLPDAWPGLRWVGVECAGARAELALTVRGGFVVWVPWAQRSPGD